MSKVDPETDADLDRLEALLVVVREALENEDRDGVDQAMTELVEAAVELRQRLADRDSTERHEPHRRPKRSESSSEGLVP